MPHHTPHPTDLQAFLALTSSPIRHPAREAALQAWSAYKLARQAAHVGASGGMGKHGVWTKGGYIASLTAPAVDLRGAAFTDVCIGYADLRGVRFDGCRFGHDQRQWTSLKGVQAQAASFRGASMPAMRLMEADLRQCDLREAQLPGADLSHANLAGADLRGANLRGARLVHANLVGADLRGTDLTGCHVYGASVWDARVDDADASTEALGAAGVAQDGQVASGSSSPLQRDLVVTPDGQAAVTVDRIEVAQFLYLLLSNPKIRAVIDTVAERAVLILGRFTEQRIEVLHALRDALRQRGFVPIVFDFEKPQARDFTETVKTLAGLSAFIISDMTNPRSNPLELQAVVPDYSIPMVPILAGGQPPFAMFTDLWHKYPWVLEPLQYDSTAELIEVLDAAILEPALARKAALAQARAVQMPIRKASDFKASRPPGPA